MLRPGVGSRLGGWGVLVSYLSLPVSSQNYVAIGGQSVGFAPLRCPFHSGLLGPPGKLISPTTL